MPQHGGKREGSGRTPLPESEKKIAKTIYITPTLQSDIDQFATGNSFSEKCIDLISAQISRRKRTQDKTVKFIDLFAGLGGIRLGFENAFREKGFNPVCVFSSEIKDYAIKAYKNYFNDEEVAGDITQISATDIEDFDFLLGGFPCQPFSAAGLGLGFEDTRGTLFFEIERILKEKQPYGFLLENLRYSKNATAPGQFTVMLFSRAHLFRISSLLILSFPAIIETRNRIPSTLPMELHLFSSVNIFCN